MCTLRIWFQLNQELLRLPTGHLMNLGNKLRIRLMLPTSTCEGSTYFSEFCNGMLKDQPSPRHVMTRPTFLDSVFRSERHRIAVHLSNCFDLALTWINLVSSFEKKMENYRSQLQRGDFRAQQMSSDNQPYFGSIREGHWLWPIMHVLMASTHHLLTEFFLFFLQGCYLLIHTCVKDSCYMLRSEWSPQTR